jgi:hypothetical protein
LDVPEAPVEPEREAGEDPGAAGEDAGAPGDSEVLPAPTGGLGEGLVCAVLDSPEQPVISSSSAPPTATFKRKFI